MANVDKMVTPILKKWKCHFYDGKGIIIWARGDVLSSVFASLSFSLVMYPTLMKWVMHFLGKDGRGGKRKVYCHFVGLGTYLMKGEREWDGEGKRKVYCHFIGLGTFLIQPAPPLTDDLL